MDSNSYETRALKVSANTLIVSLTCLLCVCAFLLFNIFKISDERNQLRDVVEQKQVRLTKAHNQTHKAVFEYTEVLEDLCMSQHYQYTVETVEVEGQYLKYITIYSEVQ